ncbi:Monocarboxylate transporter 14, partial [Fragariocoptes setiger]
MKKTSESIDGAQTKHPSIDGGYAWVIVFASFMNCFIAEGLSDSLGNFYVAFLSDFGQSKEKTSWVTSIALGMSFIPGPFVGVLIEWLGARIVTVTGSVAIFIGLMIGSHMRSTETLIFPIGFLAGGGFCLMTMPQLVVVSGYFEEKLTLAIGFAASGSALGSIVISGPLVNYLIKEYGWQLTMRLAAILSLGGVIFGLLLKPRPQIPSSANNDHRSEGHKPNHNASSSDTISRPSIEINDCKQVDSQQSSDGEHRLETASSKATSEKANKNPIERNRASKSNNSNDASNTFVACIHRIFNLKYITNTAMLIYLVGNFIGNFGFYAPPMFIKDRIVQQEPESDIIASWMISMNALAEFIGRLVTGCGADYLPHASRPYAYALATLIAGLLTILSSLTENHAFLLLYMFLFGFTGGSTTILEPVILQDLFSADILTGLYGMMLSLTGISIIAFMPIIGTIHDNTNSYQGGYILAGAVLGLSGLMFISLTYFSKEVAQPLLLRPPVSPTQRPVYFARTAQYLPDLINISRDQKRNDARITRTTVRRRSPPLNVRPGQPKGHTSQTSMLPIISLPMMQQQSEQASSSSTSSLVSQAPSLVTVVSPASISSFERFHQVPSYPKDKDSRSQLTPASNAQSQNDAIKLQPTSCASLSFESPCFCNINLKCKDSVFKLTLLRITHLTMKISIASNITLDQILLLTYVLSCTLTITLIGCVPHYELEDFILDDLRHVMYYIIGALLLTLSFISRHRINLFVLALVLAKLCFTSVAFEIYSLLQLGYNLFSYPFGLVSMMNVGESNYEIKSRKLSKETPSIGPVNDLVDLALMLIVTELCSHNASQTTLQHFTLVGAFFLLAVSIAWSLSRYIRNYMRESLPESDSYVNLLRA